MATYNKETKVWSNPAGSPVYNPNLNIAETLLHSLYITGDRVIHVDGETGEEVTAKVTRFQTIRAAQSLRALGIRRGDVIAVATRILPKVPQVIYGGFLVGAPVNLLDPGFQIAEFSSMFEQTQPKMIFCESSNIEVIKMALNDLKQDPKIYTADKRIADEHFVAELFKDHGDDLNYIPNRNNDDDIAMIVCSSGTTGTSKGISITHKAFNSAELNLSLIDAPIILVTGSLYWISNCFSIIGFTKLGAKKIINIDPFDPEKTLGLMEKYKINLLPLSPTRLSLIANLPDETFRKYDCSNLRLIITFGSVCGETLKKKLETRFPGVVIVILYAVSEAVGTLAKMIANGTPSSAVGYIDPGCEMKIIDDDGNAVDNNVQGEVLIRKQNMFHGYYGAPEKTKEVIDDDGWYHSGDIGYFEDTGCLHIVDRIKDVILYKNFWVVPGPIEDKISSLDGVREVVVVGVPHEIYVELPAAAVVKRKGSNVTEEDINKVVEDNFADAKQLRGGIYFLESLPQTYSGKYKRRDIKKLILERYIQS